MIIYGNIVIYVNEHLWKISIYVNDHLWKISIYVNEHLWGNDHLFRLLNGQLRSENGKVVKVPAGLFKLLKNDWEKFTIQSAPYYLYQ